MVTLLQAKERNYLIHGNILSERTSFRGTQAATFSVGFYCRAPITIDLRELRETNYENPYRVLVVSSTLDDQNLITAYSIDA